MADAVSAELARVRGTCTLSSGAEVQMPPTNTPFEQHMLSMEPHWVQLGQMPPHVGVMHDPYTDTSSHGEGTMMGMGGHPIGDRATAAKRLIKNHEAVIRDVCNPMQQNVIGKMLTQNHLKRVDANHLRHVEEAVRMVVVKLLGMPPSPGVVPQLTTDPVQRRVWQATCMFIMARIQVGGEKPGRAPDLDPDAALAMRTALAEVAREANGL